MMVGKTMVLAAALAATGFVRAVEVGDCVDIQSVNTESTPEVTYTAKTTKAAGTALPDGIPTPIFWLDCANTNGWLFSGSMVTGIPSRVGSRSLVTGKYVQKATNRSVSGAEFVTDVPELSGGAMLDFGDVHWGHKSGGTCSSPGFHFNAVAGQVDDSPEAVKNRLSGIKTVIAVFNAEKGGGWLLSGGGASGGDAADGQLGFLRAVATNYWCAVFQGHTQQPAAVTGGLIRHDGHVTTPTRVGFSGGWETLSFMAQADKGACYATGIGANDTRANYNDGYAHGGGQKIAEMIFFDEKLTHAQCAQVENYLKAKWFARSDRGWNGNATVSQIRTYSQTQKSTTARLTMEAAAGETLTLGRVYGGRNVSHQNKIAEVPGIDKTGAGTLALEDMTEYSGEIRIKEGSLAFPRRQIPMALPLVPVARFDASDSASLTVNGDGEVTEWKSGPTIDGIEVSAVRYSSNPLPTLRANAFGANMPTVDFGPFVSGGKCLSVQRKNQSVSYLTGVTTAFAVIGVQEGGGHLMSGGGFVRTDSAALTYENGLTYQAGILDGVDYYDRTNGTFFVDGIKWKPTTGYDHPGYHVLAMQVPGGGNVDGIGRRADTSPSGGLRLSELVIYNRVLSENEIRDISAYLMKKWMGRTAPGYAPATDDGSVDVQELKWDNPTGGTIDVPAGATVRVNKFSISGPMVKTGEGTLVLNGGSRDAGDLIRVSAGKVVYGHADPSSNCELAANPAFHLDASDTDRMDIVKDVDGNDRVVRWYDRNFKNFAQQLSLEECPILKANALNGKPTVDCGPFVARSVGKGRYLSFGVPMNAIRCVFLVEKTTSAGGNLLGSSKHTGWGSTQNTYDFLRGANGCLFNSNGTVANVANGAIYLDGVKVGQTTMPSGNYEILDVQTVAFGAHASGLATDRRGVDSAFDKTSQDGGVDYAEIIIYNRTLSDRERVATRNYLRKKWFPDAKLEELPEDRSRSDQPNGIERIAEIDSDETDAAAPEGRLETKRLVGATDFTKSGAGTLAVGDLCDYAGTISVTEGTLALTGAEPGEDVSFVESGRLFHADAMSGLEDAVNSTGITEVVKWTSRHDPSWTAEPGRPASPPTVRLYGEDGQQVVDMAPLADQFLRFCQGGEVTRISNICSVVWAIGSQNGGGFLLGGGSSKANAATQYNFHRGGMTDNPEEPENYDPAQPLLATSAEASLRTKADWFLNGAAINAMTTGLSGDWDVLSMVVRGETEKVNADGFAFDNRLFTQSGNAQLMKLIAAHQGSQRLAEVIVYNRCLTEAERIQNETYLRNKWGIRTRRAVGNDAMVSLADGTTLDLSGTKQYLAALEGSGTVANGTLELGTAVADYAATAWPEVTGTFSIVEGMTVEVRNLPADLLAGDGEIRIKILQAAAFDGLENLASAQVTGITVPTGRKASLRVSADGWLYLKIRCCGTMLMIR